MQALLSLVMFAAAAAPKDAPPPPPPVQSPEVHADGRITFRLRAPRAAQVSVAGEWTRTGAAPNAPQAMARDADGVWSVTVGPVTPNIYIYVFEVDGMTIADPVNPSIKLRARTSASMVEVPGGQPWEFRADVPHGSVEILTHASPLLGQAMRQVHVYVPPGAAGKRLPVLYLLHGNNDLAAGWTMAGRANLVLDNLIAARKAAPMLVVMPWGHALPFGTRPSEGQPTNNDLFQRYLLEEVMPLVEKRYRPAAGRAHRALVGLSMGGTQALQVALARPELFAWIGSFGAGITRADFDTRHGAATRAMMASPARRPTLFFVGVGKEDGVLARARELRQALEGHGVRTTYVETEGGHTYAVWRQLLVAAAPLLFTPVAR
jgi:enterochelin esterase-like enzyme